jgi:hypothetical protein
MPKLHELGKKERVAICRTVALAAHDCLAQTVDADGCKLGGSFQARVFKACSELGVIEDDEFYGNSFSAPRAEVLKGFEQIYEDALCIGAKYDELIAPLNEMVSDFAMKSAVLVRMRCVSRFVATLLGDSPFSDLHVTLCVAEDDDDGGVEEEEEEARSSDESDEDNDSIIATSSDEGDGSDDESELDDDNNDNDNDNDDIEEVTSDEVEEVDGPRRKKVRVKQEEEPVLEPSDESESDE